MTPTATIVDELNRLAKQHRGTLTPEQVLDAASDPKSPLHEAFDWDDASAATSWRLHQARVLIRSVRVEIRTDRRDIPVPRYVRDPASPPGRPAYVEAARVRTDADVAHQCLVAEFARIATAMRRARDLAAYFDMVPLIDDLLQGVQSAQRAFDDARRPPANH